MSNNPQTGLIGRWVIISDGEYIQTGELTLSLNEEYHLVKNKPPHSATPRFYRLVTSADLCADGTLVSKLRWRSGWRGRLATAPRAL